MANNQPTVLNNSPTKCSVKEDRRMSDEWDSSQGGPSRFQKRKGSIYATPGSRDGHIEKNYAGKFYAMFTEITGRKAK